MDSLREHQGLPRAADLAQQLDGTRDLTILEQRQRVLHGSFGVGRQVDRVFVSLHHLKQIGQRISPDLAELPLDQVVCEWRPVFDFLVVVLLGEGTHHRVELVQRHSWVAVEDVQEADDIELIVEVAEALFYVEPGLLLLELALDTVLDYIECKVLAECVYLLR